MGSDTNDIFSLAARFFYKKYKKKGGSQAEIAQKLGITQSYLSSVINGAKTASIELQSQLANILYGPYEEFLVAGRRIQKNLDPEIKKLPEPKEGVEKLIAELTYYVMDHQRIEKELANIKNFYEDIVQNLQSGVLVTDSEDNIFFVNSYMFKIFNIPTEQLLGKDCRSLQNEFSQIDITEFSEKHIEAKQLLKPLFYENVRVVTLNGRTAYLSGWMIPNIDEGRFEGMTCTLRDTSRSQELTMLLKVTLDNNNHAVGISKTNIAPRGYATTYFTNQKMRQLFGMKESDQDNISIRESLNRCEKNIVNNKEWREFLENYSAKRKKGSLIIKHTNGKEYRWVSENLLDRGGEHWGRMATVKEVNKGRRIEDK